MRSDRPALGARLEARPAAFQLAQAAWLVERLGGTRPRFRASLERAFPAGTIDALRAPPTATEPDVASAPEGDPRVELVSAAFALGGPFGPLPTPLSEAAAAAARRGSGAARDFLDLLNQRLFELLIDSLRLRETHHQPGAPFDSAAARALFAVVGLATPGLALEAGRAGVPHSADAARLVLRFAGLWGRRVRHQAGLERLLAHALGVAVRVRPLAGGWVALPPAARPPLGAARLGGDAVLGARTWDQARGVALRLGPLEPARLRAFLPDGREAGVLASLARFHLGPRHAPTVELVPDPATVDGARLGTRAGSRLGWTSWLAPAGTAPLRPARYVLAADGAAGGRPYG